MFPNAKIISILILKKLFFDKGVTYANLSSFMIASNIVLTKIVLPFGSNSVINMAIALIPTILFPLSMKNALPRIGKIFKNNLRVKILAIGVNIISVYFFILRAGEGTFFYNFEIRCDSPRRGNMNTT